jgi:broad specificity phosphatase PhoE
MKWPISLMLVRHDTSAYNALRDKKRGDSLYEKFLKAWEDGKDYSTISSLAYMVSQKFPLDTSDAETPLVDPESKRAFHTGLKLSNEQLPDVIFVSPFRRALATLEHLTRGWPALKSVKTYEEERIREQEHGLASIYSDWRVFEALHPEQQILRKRKGSYWYRYPQGENVPDVRARNRSWLTTITRDFAGKRVLVITHHLNILVTRVNLERLSDADFIRLDEEEKPINCGVTLYQGYPLEGNDGHLKLTYYNKNYYDE